MKCGIRALVCGGALAAAAAAAAGAEPAGDGTPIVGIDGAPQGAAPLELSDCVQRALEGNSELTRERLRREELRGQGWQAVSNAAPSFDVSGTWSRSRDPSFLLDESFAAPDDSAFADISFLPSPDELQAQTFWRSSIGGDWELNPFRIANSVSAIHIRQEQHDYDVAAAEHTTVEQTMRAFYEVAQHHERLVAIEADLEAREEFLNLARRRFELELATELDTLQAAVSLANLQPDRRRARKDLRAVSARLNLLMGRDALEPVTIVPVRDVEMDPVDPDGALALAADRPDITSLGLQVRYLEKQTGVLAADLRPSLVLDGRYGYVGRDVESITSGDNSFWSANVTLSVPLFDGFLTRGRVQESRGTTKRTERRLLEARREARMDVLTALDELAAARDNLRAADLNLRAAERAHQQMTLRYELGKADWLSVLNSQSERFLARSHRITAHFEVLAQTATLKRVLGVDPRTPLAALNAAPEESR